MKTTREHYTSTRVVLTGTDILKLVSRHVKGFKLTKDSKVLFQVPTGGDYSGMILDLTDGDNDLKIVVTDKEYNK